MNHGSYRADHRLRFPPPLDGLLARHADTPWLRQLVGSETTRRGELDIQNRGDAEREDQRQLPQRQLREEPATTAGSNDNYRRNQGQLRTTGLMRARNDQPMDGEM